MPPCSEFKIQAIHHVVKEYSYTVKLPVELSATYTFPCRVFSCEQFNLCDLFLWSINTIVNYKQIIKSYSCNNLLSVHEVEKDKLKEIPKAGHRLALGMKLQIEVIYNQKQPSCNKGCSLQKCRSEKRCEIKGGSQEMAMMVG